MDGQECPRLVPAAEGILSNILVPKIVFSVLRSSHPYTDIFIAPDVLAPLIQIWSQRNMPFYPETV